MKMKLLLLVVPFLIAIGYPKTANAWPMAADGGAGAAVATAQDASAAPVPSAAAGDAGVLVATAAPSAEVKPSVVETVWYEGIAAFGDRVLKWVVMGLLAFAAWVFARLGLAAYARAIVSAAVGEVVDAFAATGQKYVDGIKAGKLDGKLTDAEVARARQLAWEEFKSNVGKKGLARLARVLKAAGIDVESWFASKLETVAGSSRSRTTVVNVGPVLGAGMAVPSPLT